MDMTCTPKYRMTLQYSGPAKSNLVTSERCAFPIRCPGNGAEICCPCLTLCLWQIRQAFTILFSFNYPEPFSHLVESVLGDRTALRLREFS